MFESFGMGPAGLTAALDRQASAGEGRAGRARGCLGRSGSSAVRGPPSGCPRLPKSWHFQSEYSYDTLGYAVFQSSVSFFTYDMDVSSMPSYLGASINDDDVTSFTRGVAITDTAMGKGGVTRRAFAPATG